MKKKNKIIIGTLSTIGIGSMVIAPALAFANYQSPNNKDATSQTNTKKATTASLATTPVTTINSHTFNDNAYLQTLNQAGITNPVGKVWTVQSSLSYFKTHLQNDINVFNCATIFRWVVIQNFNYNLNKLIGTLSASSNFKVDVPNFNYTLSNIKNNGDIANFSCTLNVTIDFVITSKNDGATLSFTNNYTYNNLKYTPTITTNGYNGYGAFTLSNNANGTLTVNNATYFSRMQLSDNWTNSDFSNLLKANWLPTINPSTSITTSNYTYALADMVQRASHSISLNNNQSQFISILPTTMIDTFNLGYKFANAASVAIVMNTKGITPNANNDYTLFPGTTVTLQASQTLSSINLKNPDLAYQWEELSNGIWTNIGGATTTTYTFPVGSSTSQYRLYVYNTKNASFNLTSNSIAINPTVQNLTIDSVSNTSSYNYGSSCILQINQKNSDYDSSSVTSYQWYVNTTNSTTGGSIIKTATEDKYKFDVTSGAYYYLVLTFSNGTTLTSNAYYVTPSQSAVSVENLTPSTSITSNGQIYNGSKVTLGISQSDMDWLNKNGGKNLTYTWYQYNPYATSANDQWKEVGTSSANNPGQFSFTINQGDAANNQFVKDSQGKYKVVITNSQNPNYNLSSTPISLTTDGTVSLIPSINGQQISPNNSNYYNEPYGSKVGISVEGNHWNTTGWKYQWQYYDQATGEWKNVTGTDATSPNYTYELNGMNHSTYRLEINDGNIHMDSNPISVSANKPTISVSSTNETTGKAVTGPIQQGDKVTMSPSINGVSPDSKITWKYQWQDQNSDGQTQDIPGATSPTYTIPANKNGTYRLKITNPADPNNPIYSPWQSVNVTNNYPLVIEANATSSTSSNSSMSMVANSFEYNDNITLSMNTSDGNWDNQPKLTDLTYSWYEVGVSNPLLSSSTATTYNFTLTKNGNEYYLVITDPSGFKLTSNTIAINYETATVGISADQVNNGVATPLTNPNDITQGTTVKLDINSGNLPNTKNLTYQWQYLKDGKTWTTVSSGSSPYQFNATNATVGSYKLVITNSDNKVVGSSNVINIGLAHHPLYIANETNNTSSSTTSSSSSTTVPSSINANYNQSNITLGISGYWQNQKDVNSSNFQYQWQKQIQGSTTWKNINGANKSTYDVPPVTMSGTSYRLVITDSKISSFNLTSSPLSVTLNKVNVVIEATSPASGSTYSFGNNVNLSINQKDTTGIDLSSNYTYVWQYQNASGNFVTFPQTTNSDTLAFAIIRNSVFRLEIKSGDFTVYSTNQLTLNCTTPAATISATDVSSSTPATSFNPLTNITLTASSLTVPSGVILGYSWTNLSNPSNKLTSATSTQTYFLISPLTAQVIYELSDANNAYYDYSFNSSPISINVNKQALVIGSSNTDKASSTASSSSSKDATSVAETPSNTYNIGSTVKLSIGLTNYWDTYSQDNLPTGYKLKFQWFDNQTGDAISSATNPSYSFTLNKTTAHGYYLEISCVNANGDVVYSIKSNTINVSMFIPSLTIIASNNNSTSSTSTSTTQNSFTTYYGQPVTLSIPSSSTWLTSPISGQTYQWQMWDATSNSWSNLTKNPSTTYTPYTDDATTTGIYRLQIVADGSIINSNSLTVIVSGLSNKVSIGIKDNTNNATSFNYGTKVTLQTTSISSSLDLTGATYAWKKETSGATSFTTISGASGSITDNTVPPYTYTVTGSAIFELVITLSNGVAFTSNQVGINVNSTMFVIDSVSGDNSFALGSSATLQINKSASNYNPSATYTYQWYSNTTSATTGGTLISSSTTKSTYTIKSVTSASYYYLVVKDGTTTYTSTNSWYITPTSQKISITYTTSSPTDVVKTNTVYYGSNVSLQLRTTSSNAIKNETDLAYTWYEVNPQDPAISSGKEVASSTKYSFDAIATGTYVLAITGTDVDLISNPLTIAVDSTLTLNSSAASTTTSSTTSTSNNTSTNTIALLDLSNSTYSYGESVTLSPNSNWTSYLTASANKANFTYQWKELVDGSWKPINNANSMKYTFDVYQTGTYELVVSYKDGSVVGTFSGSINVPVTSVTAVITATSSASGIKGFATSTNTAASSETISSKDGATAYATINWGQSVSFSASITGATLSSSWTYTWQYLDQSSASWQTLPGTSANTAVSGSSITSQAFTCDQTGTYRLKLINSADPTNPIYSGIISINVNKPKLAIDVTSATASSASAIATSQYAIFKGNNSNNNFNPATGTNPSNSDIAVTTTTPTTYIYGDSYVLSIASGNYWLNSVSGLSGLTYTWYEVGNSSPLATGSTNTSYTINSLTSSGSYYCVITDSNDSSFSWTSNTITINMQSIAVSITSNQTSSPIDFGTPVTLTGTVSNISSTLPTRVSYQWQYLSADGWTNAPASSNLSPIGPTTKQYSFKITSSQTYRLVLEANSKIIAASNALSLTCYDPALTLTASASNNQTGTNFVNGSKVTITWANTDATYKIVLGSNLTYAWYNSSGQIESANTVYTGQASDSLSFTLTDATAGSYYLVISDSSLDFKLQSAPITINTNNSSISLSASANGKTWNTTSSQWTASDAVAFDTSVTLTATGSTGMDLSTGYTFSWQFLDNGVWTDYPQSNATATLTINAVRSTSFIVIATNKAGDSWTSSSIYVGITNPMISISATSGSSTTAATKFAYASYLNLDSSANVTLSSKDGSWTYSWRELGQTKPFSTDQNTNWLLTANSTFEVTYTYTPATANSSNKYYKGITFTSTPTNITVTMGSNTSSTTGSHSSTSGTTGTTGQTGTSNGQTTVIDPEISATSTNVELGENSTLSLKSGSYWATYTFPSSESGYKFTYQWMNAATNELVSTTGASGTFDKSNEGDLSYSLSSLSQTGSYYLVITCLNSSKDTVFSVRSNVVQITVTNPTVTIGYMQSSSSFDTTATSVNEGDKVQLTVSKTDQSAYWYSGAKYQWVTYDASTQSWDALSSTWNTESSSSPISMDAGVGSYKLAVEIAGVTVYSNVFTVSVNKAGRSIAITQPATVAYGQNVTLSATNDGFKSSDWTFTWEVLDTSTGKYEPTSSVFTTGAYTENNSDTTDSLTINNVIGTYTFEVVATNSNTAIADVYSNQVTVNYIDVTLDISSSTTSYKYNAANPTPITIDSANTTWKTPYGIKSSDLAYQWYENGTAIKGADTDSYTPSTTLIGTTSYYLVITSTAAGLSNYKVTSNTITITVDQPTITINSNQQTTSVDFGTSIKLSSTLSDVDTLPKAVTYQWQYLDNGTWKNAPATSNVSPSGQTSNTYSFTITSDNTYRLQLVDSSTVIATSNVLSLSCVDTPLTLSASANGTTGTSFVSGSKVTISPVSGNIYQKTLTGQKLTYTWYGPNGEIKSSDSTYTQNSDTLSFELAAATSGSYYLVITDSSIGFSITSTPITINTNNSSISLSAKAGTETWNTTTSPWTSTDAVNFATSVTLTAKGSDMDLSSGYTFTWQFLDNGVWTTYPQSSAKATLTINAVRNTSFRVIAKNSIGDSWTSSSIYVGITNPMISISATSESSTTAATKFAYASYLNLDSSANVTLSSKDGSWTYSWKELGQTKPFATTAKTNWLLTANSTFEVTYTYIPATANSSNAYYEDIAFTSTPTNITVTMGSSSSTSGTAGSHSSTSGTTGQTGTSNGQTTIIDPEISASKTNVELGQSSSLSLMKDSYWATYTFPSSRSGYTFTYAWYNTSSTTAIAHGAFDSSNETDLTQQLSSLSQTGSYYLVISCMNGSNTVFSVRSNVVQITVTYPTITIGTMNDRAFDISSISVVEGNTVSLSLDTTDESASWYKGSYEYQWLTYNASTTQWATPNASDWLSPTKDGITPYTAEAGSYILAVKIAGQVVQSNIFTVYYQSSTTNQVAIKTTTTAPFYVGSSVTAELDSSSELSKYNLTSADKWEWMVDGQAATGTDASGTGATISPYTLSNLASGTTYTLSLQITGPRGVNLTSNTITITSTTPTIQIETKSGDNSFENGTSATLQINSSASKYDTSLTYTYQWYENTTNSTSISTATKLGAGPTYKIDSVTSAGYYFLVMSNGSNSWTSNTWYITPTFKTISINFNIGKNGYEESANKNVISVYWGSPFSLSLSSTDSWASGQTGWTYKWYNVNPSDPNITGVTAISNQSGSTYTSTGAFTSNSYELVITNKQGQTFTSNVITVNVINTFDLSATNASSSTTTGTASVASPTSYSFDYGSTINIAPNSTWESYLKNASFTYSWTKVGDTSAISNETSYTYNNINVWANATYYLTITDSKTSQSITTSPITITVNAYSVTIGSTLSPNESDENFDKVALNATATGLANLPTGDKLTDWTYSWQYYDENSQAWSALPNGTNNNKLANTWNSYTFYPFSNYPSIRLVLTNTKNASKIIYSNILSLSVDIAPLQITVGENSVASSYTVPYNSNVQLEIANDANSNNPYTSDNTDKEFTYTWYKVGDSIALVSGKTNTSYTLANFTSSGQYYLEITSTVGIFPANWLIKSNIITINAASTTDATQNINVTISAKSTTNYYGQTAKVDYDSATNLTWGTNLSYQWEYSTNANAKNPTWTNDGTSATAWSSTNGISAYSTTLLTPTWVKLVVYNGSTAIATSNIVELTPITEPLTIAPTTSALSSTNGVYSYAYGTNTSLQLTGWWSRSINFTFDVNTIYTWQESTDGGTKWTTFSSKESPSDFAVTSSVMYRLVITNSKITEGISSFTLTSSIISLNVNTQASVTIAASGTDITNSGSTYTIPTFGEQTTIKATLNNISSSYTGLTYTYQYLDNGTWTNFGTTTNGQISFNDVRNCEWRLLLTGANGLSIYSNEIYLNTTMPTLTVSVKDSTTAATSFALGSIVDINANSITLPSGLSAANATTTIYNLGSSWTSLSSTSASKYVLGSNTAFKATYTYSDSTNAYYDFSVHSAIVNVTVTANPITIDAFTGATTPTVNNTYTFDVASKVNLAIEGKTSWASYTVPTGYTLSYQWYYDGTEIGTSNNTYSIPSLTNSTAGQYQLEITCVNGKNTVFTVMSNTITISSSQVNFNIGYDNSGTYVDTTYTTNYGAQGISLSIDSSTVTGITDANLTNGAAYQWEYWDASKSKWTNVPSTMAHVSTNSTLKLSSPLLASYTYRLIVSVDGANYTSNTFSLVVNPTSQNLNIAVENQTAPYTNLKYDTSYTLEPTTSWWQNITKNNPDLTCQWYVNYGNDTWTKVTSSGFNDPDGDTTPILIIKLMQDASYKLEITSSDNNFGTAGVLTSNIISLSIVPTDKGSFTIEATYDLTNNGFTYDNTGSDVSINVPYDMWFPNITLSSSNSSYWQKQCNNPNGTYTYQLQAYQEAIPGDSSVSAGWVNFADYYKNLGVSTDWTTSDGKFTGFNLTSAAYSLKMSEMWRLAITNTYTGKVTYSNSIVINVANPDIIAQSSIPDVPTYTYQSINKQAAGNSFTVVVPHGQTKYVYLNPVWNTYVNVHYSSSWTTSAYLKQYEPSTSQWITPTGSSITWTFGSKIVQQKNSSGTETSVTVYYVEFNNNTNYEGSTFDYQICLKPYKGDKPAILNSEVDANAVPVTPVSQLFTVIYGAIQSLSISAIANGTSSATTEVNGQLGQGFSVSLSPQSVQDVKTIITESEAQGQTDVHGYWVKVVNGQESVIQTAPNYKQIFCNAFLNSTEFETIMKSYIDLGGYGNYLGKTATYDDFENWNVSFQELPASANGSGYGNNVFGILNDLVITATNKSQITVDNWSNSKDNWVAGTNIAAGSLFTWTLPYTWIDSNNQSGITPTVSGTSSGSTSMTLDYLTDSTAKAISGMTQSEFDNAFNTNANGGQEIFGFSVTDPSSNQSLVDFCPFNFTSSSGHSYSSFVKNITVTVNTSFVDNYTNVPLTAIDNETIKYIVVPSSYWTTNSSGEMVPSSSYPSTAMNPVESNLIYVTIPTLNNSTFSFSNFSTLQSNWEPANSNASDIPQNPFVQLSKNYYQVPFDQAVTLSSNVTSDIANLSQIAPGYNFYIGYYFNGDLANWKQLLSTGTGLWGYNFQQVYNATSFDLSNFPITNNESIQFALFYTPDNNIFITSPDNTRSQLQPKDLNVIWESSPLTFTIASNMYATITPPSSTSTADATKAGFDRLNQTVYVLPATGCDNYVVSLDPNSSIYYLSKTENNEPYPSMSTSWINLQTFSENIPPTTSTSMYSFNDKKEIINNNYGIIGEFLEIATFGNPYWSIYASWFPNLYSMFETWMPDGATAWPTVYNAWLNSNSYKDKGINSSTYKYIPFMPTQLAYPIIKNGASNGDNIGKAIVDGTPINIYNHPFSESWYWYYAGNFYNSSTITKNAGIGSDFQYSQKHETVTLNGKSVNETYLTSNISFNYNTNISDFISGSNTSLSQSQYSYTAYAPLKFNIGAILGTEQFDEPIITRLVVFTLNNQTLNDTYYTSSDTFADVGLKVFKYVTPPLVILPAATAAKLTGASAIANGFAIPNSLK